MLRGQADIPHSGANMRRLSAYCARAMRSSTKWRSYATPSLQFGSSAQRVGVPWRCATRKGTLFKPAAVAVSGLVEATDR